jgi:hypothetical protein
MTTPMRKASSVLAAVAALLAHCALAARNDTVDARKVVAGFATTWNRRAAWFRFRYRLWRCDSEHTCKFEETQEWTNAAF